MPIAFTCPHCGRFTEVADQYAGQSGPCAGCGKSVVIPSAPASVPVKPAAGIPMPPRQGTNTTLIVAVVLGVFCICGLGLVALLLPAVQAAREAARRMQCSNNLKQIALAMHNYHDVYKSFPAGYVADEDGQPLHSWRVAILPFIECQPLYEQYNFDEPWDSPNNMRVASQMPAAYRCPSAPDNGPGSNVTHYQVVLCQPPPPKEKPDSIFFANSWTKFSNILDGTSNTLLVVEANSAVAWTRPDADLNFDSMDFQINRSARSIGSSHSGGANVVFADGSVHFLANTLAQEMLRLLIQPADGQPVTRGGY